jgi:heptosyltransferase-2
MILRRIIRKIRHRALGKLRRKIQGFLYLAVAKMGGIVFFLLRKFKLIAPVLPFEKANVKKILILRPDRIGDIILATPSLEAIRDSFPDAYIALLVSTQTRDLVISNPFVNEVIAIRYKGITGLFRNKGLIERLRRRQFDLAVVLYPALWCSLLTFLCRIPHRLGYDFHGNGFLLTIKVPYRCEKEIKHEVDVNLDVLRAIGVEQKRKELHISISETAEKRITSFLNNNQIKPNEKVVIIHPGSFEKYIRWRSSGFAEVADRLNDECGVRVVILGGPNEGEIVNDVIKKMKKKAIPALGLTIAETTSLIKRANLFIGNSTGPMHMAAALRIPVVAIFGNIHPLDCYQKWGPYGEGHIVVHKDIGCIGCHPADCRRYRCMEAVTVEDVFKASLTQLKKSSRL